MTKPNEFRKTYVVSTDVSYHMTGQKGTHAGDGTLEPGRVVWLENDPQPNGEAVSAYAEGVGVVMVAAEAVQPVR